MKKIGLINLSILLLIASLTLLIQKNIEKEGIHLKLQLFQSLFNQILFETSFHFMFILIHCILIYFISIFKIQNLISKEFFQLLYLSVECFLFFKLFSQKTKLLVSLLISLMSMTYYMKMYSYVDFVVQHSSFIPLSDFIYFLFVPSLIFLKIFEKEKEFNFKGILWSLIQIFVSFVVVYLIFVQFLDPLFERMKEGVLFELFLPFFGAWLVSSFIIFHCNLNFLAEITKFKNRTWYLDWWNSTTFRQFWRKWNKPVHQFLFHHCYMKLIERKHQRDVAIFFTFLMSGVIHELAMVLAFKTFKFYFLLTFILQIPLILFSELLENRRIGNIFIWTILMFGIPNLVLLYMKEVDYKNEI